MRRIIDFRKALEKRCTIRLVGRTFETSIPKLVVEREARRWGINPEQIPKRLAVRWVFDDFDGLVAIIEPKDKKRAEQARHIYRGKRGSATTPPRL
jgi:hypothetical protein